jgi:hypothetical protein
MEALKASNIGHSAITTECDVFDGEGPESPADDQLMKIPAPQRYSRPCREAVTYSAGYRDSRDRDSGN